MLLQRAVNFINSRPTLRHAAMSALVARKVAYTWLDRERDRDKLMVNIGGGEYFRRHWKVLDHVSEGYRHAGGSIDYPFDLWTDQPFPFATGTVAMFFCSHTLEHIPGEHCQHILDEMHRCLRPGGATRITMPDFDLGYAAYRDGDIDFFVKYDGDTIEDRFLEFFATHQRSEKTPAEVRAAFETLSQEAFADALTESIPRQSQRECCNNHINWWTYDKLSRMLRQAGFDRVYRSQPQGSRFAEMRGLGRQTGFDSTHPELSLFVEAIR